MLGTKLSWMFSFCSTKLLNANRLNYWVGGVSSWCDSYSMCSSSWLFTIICYYNSCLFAATSSRICMGSSIIFDGTMSCLFSSANSSFMMTFLSFDFVLLSFGWTFEVGVSIFYATYLILISVCGPPPRVAGDLRDVWLDSLLIIYSYFVYSFGLITSGSTCLLVFGVDVDFFIGCSSSLTTVFFVEGDFDI